MIPLVEVGLEIPMATRANRSCVVSIFNEYMGAEEMSRRSFSFRLFQIFCEHVLHPPRFIMFLFSQKLVCPSIKTSSYKFASIIGRRIFLSHTNIAPNRCDPLCLGLLSLESPETCQPVSLFGYLCCIRSTFWKPQLGSLLDIYFMVMTLP